jgi:GNAT superfamily N-acetyltransferase
MMGMDIHTHILVNRYQQHLVDALLTRVAATDAVRHDLFGFEIVHHGTATAVLAHGWPRPPDEVPFNRVYHYTALDAAAADPLLDRVSGPAVDAVVEVLAGPHEVAAATQLRRAGWTPRWQIPWLHVPLAEVTALAPRRVQVRRVLPTELAQFANVLVQGYGYVGVQATYWRTFAEHGYTAPGFHCFVAELNGVPIGAGVLHLAGATALVDGAATLPEYRGRGAQTALFVARMQYAREHGCRYAVSRTGRGSVSQQNMEKLGLTVVTYSTAWRFGSVLYAAG